MTIAELKNQDCLENDIYSATDTYIIFKDVYSQCLEDDIMVNVPKIPTLCACGCNQIVWNGRIYINLHNQRNPWNKGKRTGQIPWNKGKRTGQIPWNKNKQSNYYPEILSGKNHPCYGKPRSEETKRKLSIANKGNPSPRKGVILSDETKLKLSQSQKGKKASQETKQKLSESRKENCWPDLITLCSRCNSKVNGNREHYENLFMNRLNERGLLFWTRNKQ